jgi:hypothetical protein
MIKTQTPSRRGTTRESRTLPSHFVERLDGAHWGRGW